MKISIQVRRKTSSWYEDRPDLEMVFDFDQGDEYIEFEIEGQIKECLVKRQDLIDLAKLLKGDE